MNPPQYLVIITQSLTPHHTPWWSCPTCGYAYAITPNPFLNATSIGYELNTYATIRLPVHKNPTSGSTCTLSNKNFSFYLAMHRDSYGTSMCQSETLISDGWWNI